MVWGFAMDFLLRSAFLSLLVLISGFGYAAQEIKPLPRLEHHGDHYQLLVDGKPFLVLGGQVHNSSAWSSDNLETAWKIYDCLHANTAEIPIYWEQVEPEPGRFRFDVIDHIVADARSHGLRVVFLWFASWKNGEMHYTPPWIKLNRETYQRVIGPFGQAMEILSPLCDACREADARAFTAVMAHIRSVDESCRTVILVQVENETGLLGTDRDYSDRATSAFRGPVPADLMNYLERHRDTLMPALKAAWQQSGFRRSGTWSEVFGSLAPEAFSGWTVARYVDAVAAAGKQAYPLPMYCNNWLINPGNERAGRWPSGGPTTHVLDIWKAAAPHIDLLAPDIYLPKFYDTAAEFTRPDNPLFVPETAPAAHYAAYAFYTLAAFNGIGFSSFGIDGRAFVRDGELNDNAREFADVYRVLTPLLPLIAREQYAGRLHAVVQDEDRAQAIPLNMKLAAVVSFRDTYRLEGPRGRGLLIELSPDDYVVAGARFHVDFRELQGPARDAEFLSIEEGTFDGDRWIPSRRLNGDELHVTLPETSKILRVRLIP